MNASHAEACSAHIYGRMHTHEVDESN